MSNPYYPRRSRDDEPSPYPIPSSSAAGPSRQTPFDPHRQPAQAPAPTNSPYQPYYRQPTPNPQDYYYDPYQQPAAPQPQYSQAGGGPAQYSQPAFSTAGGMYDAGPYAAANPRPHTPRSPASSQYPPAPHAVPSDFYPISSANPYLDAHHGASSQVSLNSNSNSPYSSTLQIPLSAPDRQAMSPSPSPSDGVHPDRPLKWEKLTDEQRRIAETFPKDLDEEGNTVKESVMKMLKGWRQWIKWRYWYYYVAFILLSVLVALFIVFHHKIIDWLTPISKKVNSVSWGWVIPVAILFVISFPPLFGHEVVGILCGIVYPFWIAFGVVSLGTLLGEIGNFFAFMWCFKRLAEKHERKSLNYACMAHIVREGGFMVILIARLSAIPGHFTTAVFATVGMNIFIFTLAAVLSLPKQLAVVYIGKAIADSGTGEETTQSKVIKYVVLFISAVITIAAAWYLYGKMEKARPTVQARLRAKRYTMLSEAKRAGSLNAGAGAGTAQSRRHSGFSLVQGSHAPPVEVRDDADTSYSYGAGADKYGGSGRSPPTDEWDDADGSVTADGEFRMQAMPQGRRQEARPETQAKQQGWPEGPQAGLAPGAYNLGASQESLLPGSGQVGQVAQPQAQYHQQQQRQQQQQQSQPQLYQQPQPYQQPQQQQPQPQQQQPQPQRPSHLGLAPVQTSNLPPSQGVAQHAHAHAGETVSSPTEMSAPSPASPSPVQPLDMDVLLAATTRKNTQPAQGGAQGQQAAQQSQQAGPAPTEFGVAPQGHGQAQGQYRQATGTTDAGGYSLYSLGAGSTATAGVGMGGGDARAYSPAPPSYYTTDPNAHGGGSQAGHGVGQGGMVNPW